MLALIGGGLFGLHSLQAREDARAIEAAAAREGEELQRPRVYYNGQWYELRDDLETILFMGLDQYEDTRSDPEGYINNQQADFLFLVIVDDTAGSCTAVHINRDTMTEIRRLGLGGTVLGTFTGQLALAHTYGSGGRDSCRNTVQAVSRYLYDVPIDHYAAMTMDAIALLNDLSGGVVVHIDSDFSAIDPALEQGKDVRLRGEQALEFVRSRWNVDDNTNLSRMVRQRTYINALYEQVSLQLRSDESFGKRLAVNLAEYIESDLTTTELSELGERIESYYFTGIEVIPGEARMGNEFIEFYSDDSALQELVIRLFFRPEGGD